MLLHSPIRDVYLCIQGFDSRLACRICNNTVQSSIRAEGLSVHRETVERIRDMRGKNYGRGKDEREKDKTRKSCQWPHIWISLGTNRATPKLMTLCVYRSGCVCTWVSHFWFHHTDDRIRAQPGGSRGRNNLSTLVSPITFHKVKQHKHTAHVWALNNCNISLKHRNNHK